MNFSTRVQSQRRLYLEGKITLPQLDERLSDGRLTQEECDYILGL